MNLVCMVFRRNRLKVFEMGAGLAIPTVKSFGDRIGCSSIRINPDKTETNVKNQIGIPIGASFKEAQNQS